MDKSGIRMIGLSGRWISGFLTDNTLYSCFWAIVWLIFVDKGTRILRKNKIQKIHASDSSGMKFL
jgi:hypothetical protein